MNNFTKVSMTRLLLLLAAIFAHTESAKIYNALISSDENLTPSHAYPVVEPVLRTTALGVAFPPIIVHPNAAAKDTEKKQANEREEKKPELAYHGTLYPLAYDPYFPYAYTTDFLFPAALPFYQQPVFVDFPQPDAKKKQQQQQQQQQQQVIPLKDDPLKTAAAANFKKNPEIPDVPPPPLPVKSEKRKE